MNFLSKGYYQLTAYVPRLLPRNKDEYASFTTILIDGYDVPNTPEALATVASQVMGTPPTKIRRSYGSIANVAKRLAVNGTAHACRTLQMQALQAKLEKIASDEIAKAETQKALDEHSDTPPVSLVPTAVTSTPAPAITQDIPVPPATGELVVKDPSKIAAMTSVIVPPIS